MDAGDVLAAGGQERVRVGVGVVVRLPKGKDAASQQGCTEDGETRDRPGDKDFVVSAQQRIVNECSRLPIQKHNQQQSSFGRRSQEAGGGSWQVRQEGGALNGSQRWPLGRWAFILALYPVLRWS